MAADSKTTERDVDMLNAFIQAYYERHITGGSLHIVLDDGNWKRSNIEFCLTVATERDDHAGVAIAKMLLQAPDSVLAACDDLGILMAFEGWKDQINPAGVNFR